MEQFVQIPLKQLEESPTNPRKTFNENELKELSESIKVHGVIQPIVVREISKNKYEIIAGARRYRASQLAGVSNIPAIVKELNDEQAMEIQIIENLQRKDIHPLDEADGFQNLLNTGHYEVQSVADKFGKSHTYVYHRLRLNRLIESIKVLFYNDVITSAHAFLLCRLTEEKQKEAIFYVAYAGSKEQWEEKFNAKDFVSFDVRTVKDLKHWISSTTEISLKKAPFKLDIPFKVKCQDKEEYYDIVPCVNCPKNTSNNNTLWPEHNGEAVCSDSNCYEIKTNNFLSSKIEQLEKSHGKVLKLVAGYYSNTPGLMASAYMRSSGYEEAKKSDKNVVPAVIMDRQSSADPKLQIGKVLYFKEIKTETSSGSSQTITKKSKQQIEKEKEELELKQISIDAVYKAKVEFLPVLLKKIKWTDIQIIQLMFLLLMDCLDVNIDFLDLTVVEKYKKELGIPEDCDDLKELFSAEYKNSIDNKNKLLSKFLKLLLMHNLDSSEKLEEHQKRTLTDGQLPYGIDFTVLLAETYGISKELVNACKKIEKEMIGDYKKKKAEALKPAEESGKKNIAAIPNKSKKSKSKK